MTSAIATLQREQDDIIRAPTGGPLIVQGGPGTGKTVVALHRVAYLLFTHRQLAERAVLVLGPSARFLDYIAQVLPALGETAVVAATCDTLIPGVRPQHSESRELAELKGRALWQPALEEFAGSLLPRVRDLTLRWAGEEYVVDAATIASMLTSATRGRPYHRARAAFAEQLHHVLADAVADRRAELLEQMDEGFEDILARFGPAPTGPGSEATLSEEELDDLRDQIAGHPVIARFVAAWWPDRGAAAELRRLLSDPALLQRYAPALTAAEIALVVESPAAFASSDIPLLDALLDLLGPVAGDLSDGAGAGDLVADHARRERGRPAGHGDGDLVADRARRERGWTYGHVVVDEAQELSEMQWHMVLRRCPSRSITAVGDIDQAEAPHRHTSWAQAVHAVLGDRWTAAELTVCYRTPREVMALTAPILQRAGSHNTPPRAVRSSGIAPWHRSVEPAEVVTAAADAAGELRKRWHDGTVGVIAPATLIDALRAHLDAPVLTATQAKGLEWDAALVVDPDAIAAEPRGHNGLYVALTRCTQELGQLLVRQS